MREIKFRVAKTIFKESGNCEYIIVYDILRQNDIWNKDVVSVNKIINDTPQVMQYTGLKDKNDVEIYEGDIMKLKESKEKNEVRYLGNRFVLCKYDNIVFEDEAYFREREVVGNIYENPELLKEGN